MSDHNVVIVSAKRTPIGAFQGALSSATAPQLGTAAAKAAIEAAGIEPGDVQETIFGCVLPAGLGQAPARQAALAQACRSACPPTTINKMCGSGLKAVMLAADQIRTGDVEIVLAGGLESMTNAPYLLPKARGGYRMGHGEILDHMFYDGLQSPFDGQLMGHVRRSDLSQVFVHAAGAGCVRDRVRAPRAARGGERRLRGRGHARHAEGPQGRDSRREGRNAVHLRPEQDLRR